MTKLSALALSCLSLAVTGPVQAMPTDAASLKQVVQTRYAGNANAYAEDEAKDLKEMACKGRIDLLQALLDDGLKPADLSLRTNYPALKCALDKKNAEAFSLLLTPDGLADWENGCAGHYGCWMPLRSAIQTNDYASVRAVLESGAHYFWEHKDYLILSREEHLLLAASTAMKDAKEEAQRAFTDAGFGHILEAARSKNNVRYIENRVDAADGGGGGGLLGGIVGLAAGAAIGGASGKGMMLSGGLNALDGGDDGQPSKAPPPLSLETGRARLGIGFERKRTPVHGIGVLLVQEGSPAEHAGLQKGDIVTHIAGEPVATRASVYVATHKAAGTKTYEVSYVRDGAARKTIFGLPAPAPMDPSPSPQTQDATASAPQAGSLLKTLEKLGDLRDRGILSEDEFQQLKARALDAGGITDDAQ